MRYNTEMRKLDSERPIPRPFDESLIFGERCVLRAKDGLKQIFPLSLRENLPRVIYRPLSRTFDYDRAIEFEKRRLYKFQHLKVTEQNNKFLLCWYFEEWMEQ